MASMLLSSMRRVRAHIAGQQRAPFTATPDNDRLLLMWLTSVSAQVEQYLDRELCLKSRTEYFDTTFKRSEYFTKATPVTVLTSVYEDTTGLWGVGDGSEITDCFIGARSTSVVLPSPAETENKKALRIIYTGGLSAHAVNSVFDVSAAQNYVVGRYIKGHSSGALGIVLSYTGTALTVETYYGVFTQAETITQHINEDCSDDFSVTDAITAITSQGLSEKCPDIVMAVEAQIRYMWKHTTDFENQGTNKDGTTMRASPFTVERLPLLSEVRELLNPHRSVAIL